MEVRVVANGARDRSARMSAWSIVGMVAGVGLLYWAERRRALREAPSALASHERERVVTNLALAGLTAAVTYAAMTPVVAPLAERAVERRRGLVQQLRAPAWVRDALAVLLLDYSLYWWHVVEHRVQWIYRFHQVHHADLHLDSATALRFHFGEFLASVPWRAAQVVAIGATPRALRVWQRLTMLSVLFHHSNVRLPLRVERALAQLIMTPRLHGIHHSVVREEQDSNWSSGLTLWDRVHGTYRSNVAQTDLTIGVPAYRDPESVALRPSLEMPFRSLAPWRLPDGSVPRPAPAAVRIGELAD